MPFSITYRKSFPTNDYLLIFVASDLYDLICGAQMLVLHSLSMHEKEQPGTFC